MATFTASFCPCAVRNSLLRLLGAFAVVMGLCPIVGVPDAWAQNPDPHDFVLPASIAIVTANGDAITGPIGLPPGGSLVLKAVATERATGASLATGFTWHRRGDATFSPTTQTITISQPGSYTVEGACVINPSINSIECLTSLRVIVVSTEAADGNILSYARETVVQKAGITLPAQIATLAIGDRQQQTAYQNGLGRTIQSVQTGVAPGGRDLLSFQEYDAAGGTPKTYLPYTRTSSGTPYQPLATLQSEQGQFYQGTPAVAIEAMPYAQSVREASPLYRPLQASRVGATAAQHPGTVAYQINTVADNVRRWTATLNHTAAPNTPDVLRILASSTYAAGDLTKTVSTDEDGRTTIVFQNALGQTVLSRRLDAANSTALPLDTYTVYNDAGQVCCIIPPAAVLAFPTANTTTDQAFFQRWLYVYAYDQRGRRVSRQFPGAAPVYTVYDQFDRPILVQDGNRRSASRPAWYFTKYDQQGRTVVEGLYYDSRSWQELQDAADAWPAGASGEQRISAEGGGYTANLTFPGYTNGTDADLLSLSFYDDYDLYGDGSATYFYQDQPELATQLKPDYDVWGKLTVTRKRVINSDNSLGEWMTTALIYDQYGNVIQKQSNNLLNGGLAYDDVPNVTTLVYQEGGFRPQLERSISRQHTDLFSDLVVYNRYTYDQAGRPLRVWQQHRRDSHLDAEVLVASYGYNALGQLIDKNLHSQDGGVSFLQSVDLRYNIQGQLSSFNNSELSADGVTNDDQNDVFGYTLVREDTQGPFSRGNLSVAPRHDGTLAGVRWQARNTLQSNQPQRERAYAFNYDGLGRLQAGRYAARSSASVATFNEEVGAYDEFGMGYDANGNLTALERNKQADANSAPVAIDRLGYTYNGNQLRKVGDGALPGVGFRDGIVSSQEYVYDDNGNVLRDNNKHVQYEFNSLNKVARQYAANTEIHYDYDAGGTLLHRSVDDPAQPQVSHYYYIDGVEYEQSARLTNMASVPTPEGRVVTVLSPPPATAGPGGSDGGPITSLPPDEPIATPIDEPIGEPTETPDAAPRFVYEYHLRDHLSNLRVAFRAEAGQQQLHLTMESTPGQLEQGDYPAFMNVTPCRTATTAYEGSKAAAVNADQPGPYTTLPVADGDAVKVDFWYQTPAGHQYARPTAGSGASPAARPGSPRTVQVLPVLLPGTAPTNGNELAASRGQAGVQLSLGGWLSGWGHTARQQQRLRKLADGSGQPMNSAGGNTELLAYLQWALRDDDGNLLSQGREPVTVASGGSQGPADWNHFTAVLPVDASGTEHRTGHLTVQLVNDGSQYVYFDSVTIRHPRPALFVSQENHYYPFGMNLSGVAVNTHPADAPSKAQYNGGSTLEDDGLDAESGNYSTPYRRYDPTLGRFLGVDPLADSYARLSTYQFAGNDPVNFNDPSGAFRSDSDPNGSGNHGSDYFPGSPHSYTVLRREGFDMGVSPTPELIITLPKSKEDEAKEVAKALQDAINYVQSPFPDFNTVKKNYPADEYRDGELKSAHPAKDKNSKTGKELYINQCAIRLSKALMDSGVEFKNFYGNTTQQGYVRGAANLAQWLLCNYKDPIFTDYDDFKDNYLSDSSKQGIFYESNRSHIDIFKGSDLGSSSAYVGSGHYPQPSGWVFIWLMP